MIENQFHDIEKILSVGFLFKFSNKILSCKLRASLCMTLSIFMLK